MYNVSAEFHTLSVADSPRTRVRIYFIDDSIDCTNDADVVQYGTLLKYDVADTDSNKRIAESGLSFTERFNNEKNVEIGVSASSQIDVTFLNDDGGLDSFTYGRCKVYLDVYDSTNAVWRVCPIGVFRIELPVKRKVQLVGCTGYDQMQYLEQIADGWWQTLDWTTPKTAVGILTEMVAYLQSEVGINIKLNANIASQIVNSTATWDAPPITGTQITFRKIVEQIAGGTCAIACFDRDGALNLKWFTNAELNGNTYQIDTDTVGNNCLSIDVAEYGVNQIEALKILAIENDLGVLVGDGDNVYQLIGCGFVNGADEAAITTLATPIYNKLITLPVYRPLTIKVIEDWSLEAGDIINVVNDSTTLPLPIFQQTMTWRGGYVLSELISSGDANRPVPQESVLNQYRTMSQQHQFQVELEQFRSMIQDLSGNYTLIEQTVNSISQVVSAQGITISDILDPTGEIWTAITTNSTNISTVGNALNTEVTERKSYIRFIPQEPAIVLGVDTGNEIKLKLVNNVIYFFNGDDDSTDLNAAYAYFNSNETGTKRIIAEESVQIGNDNTSNIWLWRILTNGDLVLDRI